MARKPLLRARLFSSLKGTEIAYEAAEDETEVVYVTYPHWMDAQTKSKHAHLLDSYQPV